MLTGEADTEDYADLAAGRNAPSSVPLRYQLLEPQRIPAGDYAVWPAARPAPETNAHSSVSSKGSEAPIVSACVSILS